MDFRVDVCSGRKRSKEERGASSSTKRAFNPRRDNEHSVSSEEIAEFLEDLHKLSPVSSTWSASPDPTSLSLPKVADCIACQSCPEDEQSILFETSRLQRIFSEPTHLTWLYPQVY